jgi:FtsP/CotA-like multicopper oxidase with cupredoxin domain
MHKRKILIFTLTAALLAALVLPVSSALAQDPPGQGKGLVYKGRVTVEEQRAAGKKFRETFEAVVAAGEFEVLPAAVDANGRPVPHYFGPYPNYALSELPVINTDGSVEEGTGIQKFINSLPLLGPDGANNLGQYLPIGVPDTTTYPDADYYEIALVEYQEKMHTDIAPTTLRGYVQLSTSVVPGNQVPLTYLNGGSQIIKGDGTGLAYAVDNPHYLGPVIVAQKDKAVRIKFYNLLPTGSDGDLFIPVDTSVMGAGMGPVMDENNNPTYYTQNRATIHLHGGRTPWISDGTPLQWITPADENTPYPQGVSVSAVPDMDDTGDPMDGVMTFYYTNQQSARLMFYHDHALGITRLNVYAGEAAGYIIRDAVEQGLINAGIIPADEIPLIIQDKTFIPDDNGEFEALGMTFPSQIGFYDPTWDDTMWGGSGNLWFPHVYMPVQNPYDPSGYNAFGRWHYGPWFWPPVVPEVGPQPNPYYDGINPFEPPEIPGTPIDSMGMESFFDTPVVNGTAYPYLEVDPKAYRFRILNAANDRFWNLQLYVADPDVVTPDGRTNTEVRMVPDTGPFFPAREMGIPDPAMAGPQMIQIGNEGGFLPTPVVLPNQPISWNMDQATFNFGNVNGGNLILGPAERADVIIDFSAYAGQTIILYNDSPAPFPAWAPQFDYFTGAPDNTDTGGSPGTLPGYGPNTRTIMQIKVAPAAGGTNLGVGSVNYSSGQGYTAPMVEFIGGTAEGSAIAVATGSVDAISLNSLGDGSYLVAPDVIITPVINDTGTGATAVAAIKDGYITDITVTNGGSGYTMAPTVTFSGGTAEARATLKITGVIVTDNGTGYDFTPTVVIREATNAGSGSGAVASAVMYSPMAVPYNLGALQATLPVAFKEGQHDIIVGQSAYNDVYGTSFTNTYSNIFDTALTFNTVQKNVDGTYSYPQITAFPMEAKAIQDEMGEAFDKQYGRMSGMLGLELPQTVAGVQNFVLFPYLSPPVEIIKNTVYGTPLGTAADGTQIWKITHNGVDTHPIHFHLFEVQVINRVGWDNGIRLPDPNELGWKETVRISPLEDTIVALRPIAPTPADMPFEVPNSVRLIDPTQPEGVYLANSTAAEAAGGVPQAFAPNGEPIDIINHYVNFGWEYVWHCHILSHEEMDMMHGIAFAAPPAAPVLSGNRQGNRVTLTWTNVKGETGYIIERANNAEFTTGLETYTVAADVTSFVNNIQGNATRYYRIRSVSTVGDTWDYSDPNLNELVPGVPAFPTITQYSVNSNIYIAAR